MPYRIPNLERNRLYTVWANMHRRCKDSDNPHYGGRGIKVADCWSKFSEFYNWAIVSGYRQGLTLDRRDNGLGYSPENCRWVTYSQQARNRRPFRYESTAKLDALTGDL